MKPLSFASFALATLLVPLAACQQTDGRAASSEGSPSADAPLAGADDLFGDLSAINFKLSGPFAQLIARYKSGQADPPPPDAGDAGDASNGPEYSEPGTLAWADKTFDVRVGIRGHTSPNDCTFPKYKVEFTNKEQIAGTPFQGHTKFRVNSHCGTASPTTHGGQFSRVQNEISPIREELAYRLLRAAGVPTYRTRLGRISYVDLSATAPIASGTYHGLVIEGGSDTGKRFVKMGSQGAAGYPTDGGYLNAADGRAEDAGANATLMDESSKARLLLAESLLANFDWFLKPGTPGHFWNIDVFGATDHAPQLPIPQDFDLAMFVRMAPGDDAVGQVSTQFATFRSMFGATPGGATALGEMAAHRAAIEAELAKVEAEGIAAGRLPSVDGGGKVTSDPGFVEAHLMVDAFFALPEVAAAGVSPGGANAEAEAGADAAPP